MPRRPSFDRMTSEQTFDVFSHDSTHVNLVMEAEKESNIARLNAMDILQKYSKDIADDDDDDDKTTKEERDERQLTINRYSASPYIDCRNQYRENTDVENNSADEQSKASSKTPPPSVFDEWDAPTEQDIEQLVKHLLPLSPKGWKKNKAKQISGRFEFKQINSVLSVVKSHNELSIKSPDSQSQGGGDGSVSVGKMKVKKGKKGGMRRRFSFSSRSKAGGRDVDSGIHTDDAYLQDVHIVKDITPPEQPGNPGNSQPHKTVKKGDLPPKPVTTPKAKQRNLSLSLASPSSQGSASDIDGDEVISVASNLSDLSLISVSEKARLRGPIVLTTAMLQTMENAVIPDMICLKHSVKLSKMAILKRKLSFGSKGTC